MMTRKERLLSRHSLRNGLTLEFWDRSKLAAGDRWQVTVEARVRVPVSAANLPEKMRARLDEVTQVLGREAVFAKEEVRNFMAAGEIPRLLQEIQDMLLKSLKNYLGHPDFAAKFIGKKFAEAEEWQRLYGDRRF